MMIPYVKGKVAKQAHVGVPEGTYEEEYARNGFFGRYAHLYRAHSPVGWTQIEGPLKPRAFDLNVAFKGGLMEDYLEGRKPLLYNADVHIAMGAITRPPSYYFRNADGDEVHFIHAGKGNLETDFGPLEYTQGDYLIIPRGTAYRFNPSEPTRLLILESASEVGFPEKGMLGQHALFDPAMINVPTPNFNDREQRATQDGSGKNYELRVKRSNEITRISYPFCPIDTVGWKGTLSVQQLNVKDIRPVLSDRYHLPPSAHTTLVAHGFVVCSFLPRPLENGDPGAMKVPFYHSNIDFDEVIFYHAGEFFSRDGIREGMLTFHPQGIPHGPHKNAIERSHQKQRTDEIAVMIDTRRALNVAVSQAGCEVENYWRSWQ